jgi:hypothetical protein
MAPHLLFRENALEVRRGLSALGSRNASRQGSGEKWVLVKQLCISPTGATLYDVLRGGSD